MTGATEPGEEALALSRYFDGCYSRPLTAFFLGALEEFFSGAAEGVRVPPVANHDDPAVSMMLLVEELHVNGPGWNTPADFFLDAAASSPLTLEDFLAGATEEGRVLSVANHGGP